MENNKIRHIKENPSDLSKDIEEWAKKLEEEEANSVKLPEITIEDEEDEEIEDSSKKVISSEFEDMMIRRILVKKSKELEDFYDNILENIPSDDLTSSEIHISKIKKESMLVYNSLIFNDELLTIEDIKDSKIRFFVKNRFKEIIENMLELF